MEIKNSLAAVGFIIALANLGSVTAQANQSALDAQGEFVTISVEESGFTPYFSNGSEVAGILDDLRIKLNEKAKEACSGRDFSIDASSVAYTRINFVNAPGGHILTERATARVFCIN